MDIGWLVPVLWSRPCKYMYVLTGHTDLVVVDVAGLGQEVADAVWLGFLLGEIAGRRIVLAVPVRCA